jgi:sugar phosphate isomerase/epimerase
MKRRELVARSGGALAAWVIGEGVSAGSMIGEENPNRSRIGVSRWSFHNFFPSTRDEKAVRGATLDMLDFPEMIADRYQVHELELVAPHFAATTPAYLREVKGRLEKAHSHVVNIPVDIEELGLSGGLSDPDRELRQRVIGACLKWIDIAYELEANSVRCALGKINSADLRPTMDSCGKLAAYGAAKNVAVVVENHGGVGSEHPDEHTC